VYDTPANYFPVDDHGNHPAYFETIGFDNPDVDKTIENRSLPAVAGALRSKDREATQKNATANKPTPDSRLSTPDRSLPAAAGQPPASSRLVILPLF